MAFSSSCHRYVCLANVLVLNLFLVLFSQFLLFSFSLCLCVRLKGRNGDQILIFFSYNRNVYLCNIFVFCLFLSFPSGVSSFSFLLCLYVWSEEQNPRDRFNSVYLQSRIQSTFIFRSSSFCIYKIKRKKKLLSVQHFPLPIVVIPVFVMYSFLVYFKFSLSNTFVFFPPLPVCLIRRGEPKRQV